MSKQFNPIPWTEQQRIFREELAAADKTQAEAPEFQKEVANWDIAAGDGL